MTVAHRWGLLAPPIASPQSPGRNQVEGTLQAVTYWFHWLSHSSVVPPKRLNSNHPIIHACHFFFYCPLFPDFHRNVWVLCPDSLAHHKHEALLPIITLRTCTSVSRHGLCLWRLDRNLLPRSRPFRWMKSLHLQVKWTKTRPLRDCG